MPSHYMGQMGQPSSPSVPYTANPTTQPVTPGYGMPGYTPPGMPGLGYPLGPMEPTPQQKRSNKGLIFGTIGGVALVVLIAVFALVALAPRVTNTMRIGTTSTNTPAPTATPTIPANFKVYTDASKVYELVVPQSWTNSSLGSTNKVGIQTWTSLGSSGNALGNTVFQVEYTKQQSDLQSLDDEILKALSGTVSSKKGPTSVTIGGQSWMQESGDSASDGLIHNGHIVVQATNHGGYMLVITYAADSSNFSIINSQDFQPMVNSFTFLS